MGARPKILIVHARRTAYGVIRSAVRFKAEIAIADTERTPLWFSRYPKWRFRIPDVVSDSEEAVVQRLVEIAEEMDYRSGKPFLFTGKDDYLILFARHADTLRHYFQIVSETDETRLLDVLDKAKLTRLAEEADVPIPQTMTSDDADEAIAAALPLPVVLKPALKSEPGFSAEAEAFRLKICHTEQELKQALQDLRRLGIRFVAQEYISGADSSLYTVGVISRDGTPVAASVARKIRQCPPVFGECSYGVTESEPRLVDYATRLVEAAKISGILQIEFKRRGDEFLLIEINPRVWSWHEIHRLDGVDLVKLACDPSAQPEPGAYPQVAWQFFWMDLLHNVLLEQNVSFKRFLCDARKADLEAFLNWRDPLVFAAHTAPTLPYMGRAWRGRR